MDPNIENSISQVARENGLDPAMLRRFVQIESGGNPYARSGSYMGLLQLGPSEMRNNGGGDPFNVLDNLRAGARKIAAEAQAFRVAQGREPTPTDLYMQHQQGTGGYAMHMANPELPAWQNMAATGEGREKGESWARRAIWGNIPEDQKKQFGSVENVSSRDFVNMWRRRVEGTAGLPTEAAAGVVANPMSTPQLSPEDAPGLLSPLAVRDASQATGQVPGVSYTPVIPQNAPGTGPGPAAGILGVPPQAPAGGIASLLGGLLGGLGGAAPYNPQLPPLPQVQPLQPIQYPAPIRRPGA